jgi:hypothetical protein
VQARLERGLKIDCRITLAGRPHDALIEVIIGLEPNPHVRRGEAFLSRS